MDKFTFTSLEQVYVYNQKDNKYPEVAKKVHWLTAKSIKM